MQSARSRTTKGTPCSLRHAAVASPEGPAPTITGPFTQMQRREKKSSWSTRRNKFSIFLLFGLFVLCLCLCCVVSIESGLVLLV